MKHLITILFATILSINIFAQSRLDYSRVNEVTKVGDTLVVKFQYFKGEQLGDATLTQFDFQYNNKLLSYISHQFQVESTSAQRARNSWNGYKFSENTSKDKTDFDGQYVSWLGNTANYQSNPDWSVERITIQDAIGYPHEGEFIQYSFQIKDKGVTNYSDYTNLIQANWANYKESNGTQIDVTGQSELSLTNIQGGDAGNVVINVFSNVITNNIGDGTHFGYSIYTKSDFLAGINQNTQVIASGNFDSSGQAIIQGLENDNEYAVLVYINPQQSYLNEVVTVSDLALIFRESIGAGNDPNISVTTLDYHIQKLLGNIIGSDNVINFQDSYEVLAYLQGITGTNGNRISKVGTPFNLSGIKSTFGEVDGNNNLIFNSIITPTYDNKSFEFAHSLIGDVNFSHGYEPTIQSAEIQSQSNQYSVRGMSSVGNKFQAEDVNLDLSSVLENDEVVFTINSDISGMVGSQFNITYDKTRLILKDVIFDTGNTMTNFSNHIENDGKINIGSFDQNFETTIKTGDVYKLIFTPRVQLTNTSGLITFGVKEGVRMDGTQIKFTMR